MADGSSSDDDPSFFLRVRPAEKKRSTSQLTPFDCLVLEATRDADQLRDNSPMKKSRSGQGFDITAHTAALSIRGDTSPRSQAAAALALSISAPPEFQLCGSPCADSNIPLSPISPMGSATSPVFFPTLSTRPRKRSIDMSTSPTPGPLLARSSVINFSGGMRLSPGRLGDAILGKSPPKALMPHMKITQQPPPRAVYKRILRPCPTVAVITDLKSHEHLLENLFVEVDLMSVDQTRDLNEHLDGNRVARVTPRNPAVFNKLKINVTSAMIGTALRLVFRLKRFGGTAFELLPETVASAPVEVFSHTLYLHGLKEGERADSAMPPNIVEVIPPIGTRRGGTRICIVGEGFVDSKKLVVKFGDIVVPAQFHEEGSVIAVSPPHAPGSVPVRVSNDGIAFSDVIPPLFYVFHP